MTFDSLTQADHDAGTRLSTRVVSDATARGNFSSVRTVWCRQVSPGSRPSVHGRIEGLI
jgi:hypothetical protein